MELSKQQTDYTKGIAIAMMLCLHLFNREYRGLFAPSFFVGNQPLSYYISLFCDCCVWIYCFCSGYGLYITRQNKPATFVQTNRMRLLKLYLNYWLVLLLFAVMLGTLLGKSADYPGSWLKFLYNFSSLDSSYNGAWWFMSSYALLVVFAPIVFRLIEKLNNYFVIAGAFVLYTFGYYARIKIPFLSEIEIIQLLWHQVYMLANAIFPFVLGAIAFRHKWYSKLMYDLSRWPFRNGILLLLIGLLIVAHAVVPSLFVAVFTGIAFIFLFNAMQLTSVVERILQYLSTHSTNIWLVHLFLISSFAKTWSYAPQQPVLIYFWVLGWCLLISHGINLVYLPLQRYIFTKWFAR
jgi:hypothetical protein